MEDNLIHFTYQMLEPPFISLCGVMTINSTNFEISRVTCKKCLIRLIEDYKGYAHVPNEAKKRIYELDFEEIVNE